MNLIEQLGGYENAKSERDNINYRLSSGDFLGSGSPREYLYERLNLIETDLLEHRRANNIFESGDWAVNIQGYPTIHKVEIGSSTAHCMKIFSHDMSHSYWVHDVAYKHATPEEIQAGHRL